MKVPMISNIENLTKRENSRSLLASEERKPSSSLQRYRCELEDNLWRRRRAQNEPRLRSFAERFVAGDRACRKAGRIGLRWREGELKNSGKIGKNSKLPEIKEIIFCCDHYYKAIRGENEGLGSTVEHDH